MSLTPSLVLKLKLCVYYYQLNTTAKFEKEIQKEGAYFSSNEQDFRNEQDFLEMNKIF